MPVFIFIIFNMSWLVHGLPIVNESCIHDNVAYINCVENIKFSVQKYRSSKGEYMEIKYSAFNQEFVLTLKRKPIDDITIHSHTQTTLTVTSVYVGHIQHKPDSYFYGNYRNGRFSGELDDGHLTYTIEHIDERTISVRLSNANHSTWAFTSDNEPPPLPAKKRRSRRSTAAKQRPYNVCKLNVVISNHYFLDICGNDVSACVGRVLWYVNFVDKYFRRVDFDDDGVIENIGFVLKHLTILPDNGPLKTATDSHVASSVLGNFTRFDHPNICLNVLFLNKVLRDGVIGLAYVPEFGRVKTPGGICYRSTFNSEHLNSLLVTEASNDGRLVMRYVALTLMHELGHAFGASHDEQKRCSNDRGFGNFIMYSSTEKLINPNVVQFSICSKMSVETVVRAIGAQCLVERRTHRHCGDYQTDAGEECDCGLDGDLCLEFDRCCEPPVSGRGTCRINRDMGFVCSSVTSPCCASGCQIEVHSVRCRRGDECTKDVYCDGTSYECPRSIPETDGTRCGSGSRVCFGGKCVGSLCRQFGWLDCFCNASLASMCSRCCRRDHASECRPAHRLDQSDELTEDIRLQESDICLYGEGFCKYDGTCQMFSHVYGDETSNFEHYVFDNVKLMNLALLTVCLITIFLQVSTLFIIYINISLLLNLCAYLHIHNFP